LTVVTDVTKEVVKAGLKASFGSKNSWFKLDEKEYTKTHINNKIFFI
jgi:hypothetical protein